MDFSRSIFFRRILQKSIFEDENLPWDFVCQWKNFGPEVFFLNELGDKEDNEVSRKNK